MGGGDSAVGIALEQVSSGFDGTNYGERADPSVHEGFAEATLPNHEVNKDFVSLNISRGNSTHIVVPLLALLCNLSKEGEHLLELELSSGTIHVGRFGMDVNG